MPECWNVGSKIIALSGKWKIQLGEKIQDEKILIKTQYSIIPLFHYSMLHVHAYGKLSI